MFYEEKPMNCILFIFWYFYSVPSTVYEMLKSILIFLFRICYLHFMTLVIHFSSSCLFLLNDVILNFFQILLSGVILSELETFVSLFQIPCLVYLFSLNQFNANLIRKSNILLAFKIYSKHNYFNSKITHIIEEIEIS